MLRRSVARWRRRRVSTTFIEFFILDLFKLKMSFFIYWSLVVVYPPSLGAERITHGNGIHKRPTYIYIYFSTRITNQTDRFPSSAFSRCLVRRGVRDMFDLWHPPSSCGFLASLYLYSRLSHRSAYRSVARTTTAHHFHLQSLRIKKIQK